MNDHRDDPHEPWLPRRGQWVRVRLSGECRVVTYYDRSPNEHYVHRGHDLAEDGAVGWVIDLSDPGEFDDGHRVLVQYDREVMVAGNDHPQTRQHFAVIELEPIPPPGLDAQPDE